MRKCRNSFKKASDTILSDFSNPLFFPVSPPRVGKVGEIACGKIRVGNPKEQDPFKVPQFLVFHICDKTNDMSANNKCRKSKIER
jgi:hypothetical protein